MSFSGRPGVRVAGAGGVGGAGQWEKKRREGGREGGRML